MSMPLGCVFLAALRLIRLNAMTRPSLDITCEPKPLSKVLQAHRQSSY